MLSSSQFELSQYSGNSTTYFLLVDPALQTTVRFGEIKGMVEAFSFRTREFLTVVPRPERHAEFKAELIEFLTTGTCDKDVVEMINNSQAAIVSINWRGASLKKGEQEKTTIENSERDVEPYLIDGALPIVSEPMKVMHSNIENLFDEHANSALSTYDILSEIYQVVIDPKSVRSHTRRFIEGEGNGYDYIMLKPSLFGIGVDLNKLFKDLVTKWNQSQE